MSDKTTAALAAEQADTEATTTQEAELLPAATLDELEQVDLGTVAEGERAPFRITDDRCADWAIRKIADERSEYDRLKALADEQIAAINEKVAAARKRMENGTSYLTSCLADFFATVPHKETKTTEKYRLLSGTLTFKKGTTKTKLDETKLVPWLKANGYGELVKVEESTRWADLKKLLSYTGDIATLTETGEIVEGVTVYEALRNKPKINGHELIGDMTPAQLGITDDRHHTHKQAQAAKVWTVAHNLGKRPAVTVVDSAGTVVIGEVDYLDDNTVRLTFCAAFSGTAYFN